MGRLLLSGETGHPNSLKDLKKQREDIADKWVNLGFLDGLVGNLKPEIGKLYESEPSRLSGKDVKKNIARYYESDDIQFLDGYEDTNRWCVYILECIDDTLYTGMSNNIVKRLRVHRSGKGAKYTRGRLPAILRAYKVVDSKSEALKLEYKVKQQRRDKKVTFLRDY